MSKSKRTERRPMGIGSVWLGFPKGEGGRPDFSEQSAAVSLSEPKLEWGGKWEEVPLNFHLALSRDGRLTATDESGLTLSMSRVPRDAVLTLSGMEQECPWRLPVAMLVRLVMAASDDAFAEELKALPPDVSNAVKLAMERAEIGAVKVEVNEAVGKVMGSSETGTA